MLNKIKLALITTSIAVLSACGGGGDVIVVTNKSFFSVDNIQKYGVVCVEDLYVEAGSAQGTQVAVDLANYFGLGNPLANPTFLTYSGPTYCGGPTSNFVPAPGLIVSANDYYNVIVPAVR